MTSIIHPRVIDKFKGEYAFLSNFAPSPIVVRGEAFPTVEHAFQAWKMTNAIDAARVQSAPNAALAKKLAKSLPMRSDWDIIKRDVMFECCKIKFTDSMFTNLLLDTGDAQLIEGNYWGDTYWGVCRGVGQNYLGKILMSIRAQLRA